MKTLDETSQFLTKTSLAALCDSRIRRATPEVNFDALTGLAADICGTPIALVSLVDAGRHWFNAKVGLDSTVKPADIPFCGLVLLQSDIFIVSDAMDDERLASQPPAASKIPFRFHAGAPLINPDGLALGTLCVIDMVPRTLKSKQIKALRTLGNEVVSQLELHRENRRLEEIRERLRLILKSVGEGIYGLDMQGRVNFINPAASRMLGWEAHELIGRPMHETVHHSHANGAPYPKERCPIYAALKDGAVHTVDDEVFWSKDGSCFPVRYTSTPVVRQGQPFGTVVIFRDITARKRREAALQYSEERYRSLVTATASVVWTAAPDGAIVEDAPSWQAFTGQTPAEYKGLGWLSAIHPDDRRRNAESWRRGLKSRTPVKVEDRLRHRDGRYRDMLVRAVPVFDADGRLREWVGHCSDITARKQAEARLRHLASHDALTALPDRILFMDRLGQALADARRHKRSAAVLYLDLDGFKQINDTLGHDAGDLLLKEAAQRLLACVRANDTVARMGGDEFTIILTDIAQAEDVNPIAGKILAALSERFQVAGNELFVTASIGVSLYPGHGGDPHHLLKNADAAMYAAKQQGKNCYRYYATAGQA